MNEELKVISPLLVGTVVILFLGFALHLHPAPIIFTIVMMALLAIILYDGLRRTRKK